MAYDDPPRTESHENHPSQIPDPCRQRQRSFAITVPKGPGVGIADLKEILKGAEIANG